MDHAKILLDMIKCCVTSGEYDFGKITESELTSLYKLSKAHDLAHFVALALKPNGMLGKFPVGQKLDKELMTAVYRYTQMNAELESICEVLEKAHIKYTPLKGAVIREYYPEPWMRTSCDIDILVHKNDIRKARYALARELNYRVESTNYHDVSMFSENGVHLELHFMICENILPMDDVLKNVWEYVYPSPANPYKYVMSGEFLLFHATAHTAYHFQGGGCGIRPILDLCILKNRVDFDTEKLYALLETADLKVFWESICELADMWFEDSETGERSEKIERMSEFILDNGVYGTKESAIAIRRTTQGNEFLYILKRLFPPYEQMRIRNPILQKAPILLPVIWITRLFEWIFTSKKHTSIQELKINSDIHEAQVDKMKDLLREVGLNRMKTEQ